MSSPFQQSLEQQLDALQEENRLLRGELDRIEQRAEAVKEARKRLVRGTWRILVPLLDRQKVVRSFAKLAETSSNFAGPMSGWPAREEVLADARDFLESCVRFVIRRRTLMLLFSLFAASIPALQIWLVVQQNEIIDTQNRMIEEEQYRGVAEALSSPDRNARQLSGVLLANTRLEFLDKLVVEVFEPSLSIAIDNESLDKLVGDADFRAYVIRAVVRNFEQRGQSGESLDDLYDQARPMFQQILRDAAEDRLIRLLREGRDVELSNELRTRVDNYIFHVGRLLRVYGRLARAVDEEQAFFTDLRPLFQRLASLRGIGFTEVYQVAMQDFLLELAMEPTLSAAPGEDLAASGTSPEQALRQGFERLQKGLGEKALNWGLLEKQIGVQ
ncbi:hypothetical protein [Haliangium sp.]|uniref:hypothetical protein n=1 Tax=Haliangium sp. TaxID=2663208 RepID=UPI003D0F5DEE